MIKVKMMKISPNAKLFSKAHKNDACYDIYALENENIGPNECEIIRTGIKIELPIGYEGVIRSRSGLASNGIIVANSPGTIDEGYRGEICVILANLNDSSEFIRVGDRIAQFTIKKVIDFEIEEVEKLSETERGAGGFGSTGN
jgi:dUTP pyrophosphatase